jgi:GrpB-like predicted nucleotidyltransferase (UPF0157 family)
MPSLYTFEEYSPEWPAEFTREAERWNALLGAELVAVHHIGSTSVPGLAAKPIIDLLPLVRSISAVDERSPSLVTAGYKAWGEYGLPGRRYFTKDRGAYRSHNIHVYQSDHPEVSRHLAFCAFLRSHPKECAEYESVKRGVYAQFPNDVEAYNDGKDAWIKRVEKIALEWRAREPAER